MTIEKHDPGWYTRLLERALNYLIPAILGYGVLQLTKIRDELSTLNATTLVFAVRLDQHDKRLDMQADRLRDVERALHMRP